MGKSALASANPSRARRANAFALVVTLRAARASSASTRRQRMTVRKDIVVLDCGGSSIKAGFAGDDKPAWCASSPRPSPLALKPNRASASAHL